MRKNLEGESLVGLSLYKAKICNFVWRILCWNETHGDMTYVFNNTWNFSTVELPALSCRATLLLHSVNNNIPLSNRRYGQLLT